MKGRNQRKTKRVSVLLILVLLLVNSLSYIMADEYTIPASELSEEAETQDQTETWSNSISGVLWIDENMDGIYDAEEVPVSGYSVYLYSDENLAEVQKVTTDEEGYYEFTCIESGDYIVGIKAEENETGYLLPVVEVTDDTDNKFTVDDELLTDAYSEIISVAEDSVIIDINCGMGQKAEQIESDEEADVDNTQIDDSINNGDGQETEQTDNADDSESQNENSTEDDLTAESEQTWDYTISPSDLVNNVDANSISGTIWLDQNEDGIYDSSENPVAGYEVSLYLAANTSDKVDAATTDENGLYKFTDLKPNDYVVGITLSQSISDTEYLVPLIGIKGDNKFAVDETTYDAYTNTISLAADTEAKDYSAGVRLPAGMQILNVGVQTSANTTYDVNSTVIGFGGHEWWVIGDASSGIESPAGSITLFSKNNDFKVTAFQYVPGTAPLNNYHNSDLKIEMNALDTDMFSSGNSGNAQEADYVTARDSMDLNAWDNTCTTSDLGNPWNFDLVYNQKFWPISILEWVNIGNKDVRSYDTYYWTRTPLWWNANFAYIGYPAGYSYNCPYTFYEWALRPAFYLDTTKVIFSSEAAGSGMKTATAGDPSMEEIETPTGTIKLTMEDNTNLALDTTTTQVYGVPEGTSTFNYNGVTIGTNKSVSVIICDTSGNFLYYGRPVDLDGGSTQGTASFKIPSSLPAGDYILKVFNEEVNGEYYTDYASTPVDIPLRVNTPEAVTLDATNVTTASATLNGTYNTGNVSGTVFYQYGTSATNLDNTTAASTLTSGTATALSTNISGLTQGTTYYFRIVVYSGTYYYGEILNFTTPVELSISKTVQGPYGDITKAFEITVTLTDSTGTALTGDYTYTGSIISGSGATPPADGTLTLINGSDKIFLKHGQKITITGISPGTKFVVEETDSDASAYDISYNDLNPVGGLAGTLTKYNMSIDILNYGNKVPDTSITGLDMRMVTVGLVVLISAAAAVFVYSRRRRRS